MSLTLFALAVLITANAIADECGDVRWRVFAVRVCIYATAGVLIVAIGVAAGHGLAETLIFSTVIVAVAGAAEADLRWLIIPDVCSLILIAGALLHPGGASSETLIGAVVAGGLLLAVKQAFLIARGLDGLGWGDVKLATAMGALLGPSLVLSTIAAAAIASGAFLLYCRRNDDVVMIAGHPAAPLGAGLAAATLGAYTLRFMGYA